MGPRPEGTRVHEAKGGLGQLPAEKSRCPGGSGQAGEAQQTRRYLLTEAMVDLSGDWGWLFCSRTDGKWMGALRGQKARGPVRKPW